MMKVRKFLSTFTGGSYRFDSVKSEAIELLDECGDLLMATQCWVSTVTGWDWEMVLPQRNLDKYKQRLEVWKDIFAAEGLVFSTRYLVGGGNHEKPAKVRAALELARVEQRSKQ